MADVNNVDEIVEEVNKPLKESIKEKAEKIKDKANDTFFIKAATSSARAFKTGLDIGTLRGLNHNGKYKLGLGAMGTMAGIGATIGASASAITPDSPVDPLTGAIVGGAIGAASLPVAGMTVGAIGSLGVGLVTKGIPAAVNLGIKASPYVAGIAGGVATDVISKAWNFSKRLINWDEGASGLDKVKFTGPISGFKAGLNMETKNSGLLGKIEQGVNAGVGTIINGKTLMLGASLFNGIRNSWNTIEQANMGANMGVVTNTPQVPAYANNAGATGDLVFAMNANRRG